ncbi:MAG: DUF4199 domain-containing protein [Chitinophagaceae bacterium]
MKLTIIRYGIYAASAIVILSAIHFFILLPNSSYETAEIAGYLTMILSMIFVFAGIRHYRNNVNDGYLSFTQGLKVGALIVLIPAVAFALFDILYTKVLNPSWGDAYLNYYIEKIKATTPAAHVDEKIKELRKNMEMFSNPAFQFLLMAGTVYIIGLIVTIISTLALRRNKSAIAA